MDQTKRAARQSLDDPRVQRGWKCSTGGLDESADALLEDHINAPDVNCTPVSQCRGVAKPAPETPCTPQECTTMVNAVEQAMMDASTTTPGTALPGMQLSNLQTWLRDSGLRMPTPAARDIKSLTAAAAENHRLKKQLEALREAELELAAREAEENAENFALLEEENLSLAADNARLQQQIAELEAINKAASAAAQERQQQAICLEPADGINAKAAMVLQRAEHARRLSGVYEEKQLASFKQLTDAEEQLSAVKSLTPTSRAQQKEMHRRLLQAEQDVQTAAAAAQEATKKLQLVLDEKEKVQQELQEIKQQLEAQPVAQQHADLYNKLAEVHKVMLEEKQQHQKLTGSLLEHAGRLSHKYYALSDDYGDLQKRYHHLLDANDQLASQLKEAHEALYELQVSVQATPPSKRREQQHLILRVSDAEQAVRSLERDKQQLHDRLLQAQAFIACLEQRSSKPSVPAQQVVCLQTLDQITPAGDQIHRAGSLSATPAFAVPAATQAGTTAGTAAKPQNDEAPATERAAGVSALNDQSFSGFVTPVKGRSNPLFDAPDTPGINMPADSAAAAQAGVAHLASFPAEPVSPILAAAAEALQVASGQQQKQCIQLSAASRELQTVQHEQLGLREELIKAKSALADIAGQLRASICGSASSSRSGGTSTTHSTGAISSKPPGASGANRGSTYCQAEAMPAGAADTVLVSSVRSCTNASSKDSNIRSTDSSRNSRRTTCIQQQKQQTSATSMPVGRAAAASQPQDFAFPQLSKHTATPAPSSTSSGSAQQRNSNKHPKAQGSELLPMRTEPSHQTPLVNSTADEHVSATGKAVTAGSSQAAGSLSLDDLIKEAESVSLEYGLSPQKGDELNDAVESSAVRTAAEPQNDPVQPNVSAGEEGEHTPTAAEAAARRVALALVEHGLTHKSGSKRQTSAVHIAGARQDESHVTPVQHAAESHLQQEWNHSCHSPHSVAGSADPTDARVVDGTLQLQPDAPELQQQQLLLALLATPGSASSAAGMPHTDRTAAAKQCLRQQVTPLPMVSVQGDSADELVPRTVADMSSAVRVAAAEAVAYTPAASTPASGLLAMPSGMEGCASNILLTKCSAKDGGHNLQQALLTPSYATPTVLANQRAAIAELFAHEQAAADNATSGLKHSDGRNDTADNKPLQWNHTTASAAGSCVTPAVGTAACKASAAASVRDPGAADVTTPEVTSGVSEGSRPTGFTAAAAAAAASETPDALQKAAAALIASISPAGLLSSDVVPAQLSKHLTPEWLKELRHKCQQGTLQVKELRQQFGLATPEVANSQAAEGQETHQPMTHLAGAEPAHAEVIKAGALQKQVTDNTAADPAEGLVDIGVDNHRQASTDDVSVHVVRQESQQSITEGRAQRSSNSLRRRALAQASAALITPAGDAAACTGRLLGVESTAVNAYDDLERTESSGSLAKYMQGNLQQRQQSDLRAGSVDNSGNQNNDLLPYPVRPDCPTPGSAYSFSSTPDAPSPDLLLAGLNHSRVRARHLQEQLQRHLEKTTSLPSNIGADHGSAADGMAAITTKMTKAADLSEAPVGTTHCASAAAVTPVTSARTGSRLCSTGQVNLMDMLPTASPITPGAALNASAESRLLSTSVQLDQVFNEVVLPQSDCTDQQQQQHPVATCDFTHARSNGEQHVSFTAPAAPTSFPVSVDQGNSYSLTSCGAETATAAYAGPMPLSPVSVVHPVCSSHRADTLASTTSSSIKAHQLSSLAAGTCVMSSECYEEQTPASYSAAAAQESSVLQPQLPAPSSSATAAANSAPVGAAASDPSLGSWVASYTAETSTDDGGAACVTAPVSHVSAVAVQSRPSASAESRRGYARGPSGQVHLGDSPSESRLKPGSAVAAALQAASSRPGEGSKASTAETPSSCCALQQAPQVSLGSSPGAGQTLQQFSAASISTQSSATLSENVPRSGWVRAATGSSISDVSGNAVSTALQVEEDTGGHTDRPFSVAPSSDKAADVHTDLVKSYSSEPGSRSSGQLTEVAAKDAQSQHTVEQPANSDCTDFSSCRFATPALGSMHPDSSDSGQVYFTGLQHTSRSVSGRASSAHKVEEAAFAGFATRVQTAASPAPLRVSNEDLPAAAANGGATGEQCPVAQNLLLQQLLASPGSSCASGAGSPAWPETAAVRCFVAEGMEQVHQQVDGLHVSSSGADAAPGCAGDINTAQATQAPDTTGALSSQPTTCSRGSQTPEALAPSAGGAAFSAKACVQQASPKLSDLGFIDAPTSADFVAQQEVSQQQLSHQGSVKNKHDDLTGMTFQQRLELLCAENSSESEASAASRATAAECDMAGDQDGEEQQTPVLPAHVMSRATQTSPMLVDAAVQRNHARDAETQCTPVGRV